MGDVEDCCHSQLLQEWEVAGVLGTAQDQVRENLGWRSIAVRVIVGWSRLELQFPLMRGGEGDR